MQSVIRPVKIKILMRINHQATVRGCNRFRLYILMNELIKFKLIRKNIIVEISGKEKLWKNGLKIKEKINQNFMLLQNKYKPIKLKQMMAKVNWISSLVKMKIINLRIHNNYKTNKWKLNKFQISRVAHQNKTKDGSNRKINR